MPGLMESTLRVSIHAPARGATLPALMYRGPILCFNPRPCARGDQTGQESSSYTTMFQSTPLREGRRHHRRHPWGLYQVSIHAPARGATRYGRNSRGVVMFQSTPLREGRQRLTLTGY